MKIKRILSLPFTIIADVATLGNLGEGSFTGRVFNAERRERQRKEQIEDLNMVVGLLNAISNLKR